jgi:hypothetical protein
VRGAVRHRRISCGSGMPVCELPRTIRPARSRDDFACQIELDGRDEIDLTEAHKGRHPPRPSGPSALRHGCWESLPGREPSHGCFRPLAMKLQRLKSGQRSTNSKSDSLTPWVFQNAKLRRCGSGRAKRPTAGMRLSLVSATSAVAPSALIPSAPHAGTTRAGRS